jgi:hypothetical protein
MPRELVAFATPDLSTFARALARLLKTHQQSHQALPGHVELLNLIARAAGQRNFQALRAALATTPATVVAPAPPAPPATLTERARKALAQFDADGRLVRWPNKFSVQRLAMWVLWTRFEAKRVYTEREVNAILKDAHTFGDHVTLRRALVDLKLLTRKSDCSEYRKVAARPDDETRALLHAWRGTRR